MVRIGRLPLSPLSVFFPCRFPAPLPPPFPVFRFPMTSFDAIFQAIAGKRVLVIGDLMLDKYIWGDASRLSPEAPVPVVRIDRETAVAGGAANVAINLAALGAAPVQIFGWIGCDADGEQLHRLLHAAGVQLLEGAASPARHTIAKTRVVCRRQQLCRLDYEAEPATYALTEEALLGSIAPAAAQADAILLSDYAKGVLTSESIRAIRALPRRPEIITLDPKPRPGIDYSGLSLLTPNRAEALRLAGLEDTAGEFPAEAVCRALQEKAAPAHLVVTLGPDGMLLAKDGKPLERIPTFAREVFDVSGAGDTVIAALTLCMAAGIPLPDAARFANTAAGVVVGKLGTATATPDEIRAYAASISR